MFHVADHPRQHRHGSPSRWLLTSPEAAEGRPRPAARCLTLPSFNGKAGLNDPCVGGLLPLSMKLKSWRTEDALSLFARGNNKMVWHGLSLREARWVPFPGCKAASDTLREGWSHPPPRRGCRISVERMSSELSKLFQRQYASCSPTFYSVVFAGCKTHART